jgi:GPH family glycoside/pentoside/hexuronide:cation symporter
MTSERLRIRTKVAFGIGAAAEAGAYIAFNTFNFLFYNNVLGLSGTLCGLAVTIALCFDAVSDPLIGFISDRWRGKLGRRHPFMYAAPLPAALSFYLIYAPPESLQGFGLFLWFTFFTLLFRQAISLYQVPHLALGAELTRDYHERTVVMSYNSLFQWVGGFSASFFGWTWLGSVEGGSSKREMFTSLAGGVAIAVFVIIFASAHFTRDRIPLLPQAPADQPRMTLKLFFREATACLKNRNYAVLLLGLLFLSATTGTRETINSYISLFFWELPESKIRLFALASGPAFIISFFLTVRLHRWFEKRTAIIGSLCLLVFAASTPITLRVLGVFPENGTPALVPSLMTFTFLGYLGVAILMISVNSALGDIADDHELSSGRRQEGMFYAARAFFGQLSSGLGHLLAGIAIDLIGFIPGSKPGEVADDVLFRLGLIDGPLASIPALIAIVFYARYRIDKRRHVEIQRELASRRPPPPHPVEASVPAIDALPESS